MTNPTIRPGDRFLRRPEVCQKTGLPTSSLYAAIRSSNFPAGIRATPGITVWTESSIESWMAERIALASRKA